VRAHIPRVFAEGAGKEANHKPATYIHQPSIVFLTISLLLVDALVLVGAHELRLAAVEQEALEVGDAEALAERELLAVEGALPLALAAGHVVVEGRAGGALLLVEVLDAEVVLGPLGGLLPEELGEVGVHVLVLGVVERDVEDSHDDGLEHLLGRDGVLDEVEHQLGEVVAGELVENAPEEALGDDDGVVDDGPGRAAGLVGVDDEDVLLHPNGPDALVHDLGAHVLAVVAEHVEVDDRLGLAGLGLEFGAELVEHLAAQRNVGRRLAPAAAGPRTRNAREAVRIDRAGRGGHITGVLVAAPARLGREAVAGNGTGRRARPSGERRRDEGRGAGHLGSGGRVLCGARRRRTTLDSVGLLHLGRNSSRHGLRRCRRGRGGCRRRGGGSSRSRGLGGAGPFLRAGALGLGQHALAHSVLEGVANGAALGGCGHGGGTPGRLPDGSRRRRADGSAALAGHPARSVLRRHDGGAAAGASHGGLHAHGHAHRPGRELHSSRPRHGHHHSERHLAGLSSGSHARHVRGHLDRDEGDDARVDDVAVRADNGHAGAGRAEEGLSSRLDGHEGGNEAAGEGHGHGHGGTHVARAAGRARSGIGDLSRAARASGKLAHGPAGASGRGSGHHLGLCGRRRRRPLDRGLCGLALCRGAAGSSRSTTAARGGRGKGANREGGKIDATGERWGRGWEGRGAPVEGWDARGGRAGASRPRGREPPKKGSEHRAL
jgi:hypothetical protein